MIKGYLLILGMLVIESVHAANYTCAPTRSPTFFLGITIQEQAAGHTLTFQCGTNQTSPCGSPGSRPVEFSDAGSKQAFVWSTPLSRIRLFENSPLEHVSQDYLSVVIRVGESLSQGWFPAAFEYGRVRYSERDVEQTIHGRRSTIVADDSTYISAPLQCRRE